MPKGIPYALGEARGVAKELARCYAGEILAAMLDRIDAAIKIAVDSGGVDGAHHKAWVIDQMVRALAVEQYRQIVLDAKRGHDGDDTYDWDEGIAP